ncbi:MAG: transposase [Patescibacteria group bacterium]
MIIAGVAPAEYYIRATFPNDLGSFVMTQRRTFFAEYPYFVTFRTKEGFQLFEKVAYAELMAQFIRRTCSMKGFEIIAWQIMPDHVHLLIQNIHPRAQASLPARTRLHSRAPAEGCARGNYNVSQCMHTIKSYFCRQIRTQYGIRFAVFQKRFYARAVTSQRYFDTVIRYIAYNPVKAELPSRYRKPPYQYVHPMVHL